MKKAWGNCFTSLGRKWTHGSVVSWGSMLQALGRKWTHGGVASWGSMLQALGRKWTQGSVANWGSMPQAGMSWLMSLHFSTDLTLNSASKRNEYRPHAPCGLSRRKLWAVSLEHMGPYGPPRPVTGIASLYLLLHLEDIRKEMVTKVWKKRFASRVSSNHETVRRQRAEEKTKKTEVSLKQNCGCSCECSLSILQKEDTQETMAAESLSLVLLLPAWVRAHSNRINGEASQRRIVAIRSADHVRFQLPALRCRRHNGKHKAFQNNSHNFYI
jgi:hypothetical protein